MARDNFSPNVRDRLRTRVACRCSNPSCRAPTAAPGTLDDDVTNIGVAAHIYAASSRGPRYRSEMSPRERSAITNGIWLCANCSITIDRDVERYTADLLFSWRESAENIARAELGKQLPSTTSDTEAVLTVLPSHSDVTRAQAFATALLEAGKRIWRMPSFVAPVTLEEHERNTRYESRPISSSELLVSIEAGANVVLFGECGVGKTTLMLDLCTSSMVGGRCIPLFVDAALWARSDGSLFKYLTSHPSAEINGVTPVDLTRLAEAGRLVIMLNGWNEISASSRLSCWNGLIHQAAATEGLSIVVASRSPIDSRSFLLNVKQIRVCGLTWEGQSSMVRTELVNDVAAPLMDRLAKDTRLRHASRSPLILQGLIAQARKGVAASSSVFDLLAATVQAYEEEEQRNHILSIAPVDGHQRVYLEELACLLTHRLETNCSRDAALQAMHSAATQLAEHRLIGVLPSLTAVLDVLISHHLVHLEDGMVRFAHQRFQEYFAAARLLRNGIGDDASSGLLRSAVNQPAWEESLMLVAGKLKGEGGQAATRARMVKIAAAIDLGVACDLTGICTLSDVDDPELHRYMVARVNKLAASPLEEVRDLGVAYQIASGLPAFAESLWPLIESENQQTRLHTHRLNGTAIAIAQLGTGAEQRVASWSSQRRGEFVHEIADNADNYEFLVALAQCENDPTVRAAAISALFWNFPASDVPVQAWLEAPVEVQTEHNLLSYIQYALEDGYVGDAVRERLQTIAINDISDSARLQLTLAFPNEVGPSALSMVFERLRSSGRHGNDTPLVAIARTHAPERLLDLARELALDARIVPEWARECLYEAPTDVSTDVFERAWTALHGSDFKNLSGEVLGPLADRHQTERSVALWLHYTEAVRGTLTDIDHDRQRQLGYLLAHAPERDLLNVVMTRGQAACYREAVELVELVLRRIGRDDVSARTVNQWLPTHNEVSQLVMLFVDKAETADVPQDTVRVHLCSVASHVAPAEFKLLLLETCRRHLDAWSIYQEKIDQWAKNRTLLRPQNPQGGYALASALSRWGPDALPSLLELMVHTSAMKFVPEVIGRIISLPWASMRERSFSSVSTDIQEGEQRRRLGRDLRQPDDTFQRWTDEAAKVLGQKLSTIVSTYQDEKASGEKWNARQAEYHVGGLAGIMANIPSAEVVEPIHRALASGLMDVYGTVAALRGLLRQGVFITNSAVVRQIDALYELAAVPTWHDQSSRYAMSELSALRLCGVSASLLTAPISHYLERWGRFSHPDEIIRDLGAAHSEAAWPALLEFASKLAKERQPPEELVPALVSALAPQHLTEFLELVANGTFCSWCRTDWSIERFAPGVAAVLSKATGQVEAFVEACRQTQSPLADTLVGEVLSHITGTEEVRQSFLLEALDAGRAENQNMPAYRMLQRMFTLKVPIDSAQYEVAPKACDEIRAQLYTRAKGTGPIADGCRRLLASLESGRRETGRPGDEQRHPFLEEGIAWTDVLLGP
jgi:hypothetical protein